MHEVDRRADSRVPSRPPFRLRTEEELVRFAADASDLVIVGDGGPLESEVLAQSAHKRTPPPIAYRPLADAFPARQALPLLACRASFVLD
jgi:hypothetical protein